MWAAVAADSTWSRHTFPVARVAIPTSGATRALAAVRNPRTCVNSATVSHSSLCLYDRDLVAVRWRSPHLPVSRPTLARSCDSINILSSPSQLVLASCPEPSRSSDTDNGPARLSRPAAAARPGRQSSRSTGHVVRNLLSSSAPHYPDQISWLTPSHAVEPFVHSGQLVLKGRLCRYSF